MNTTNLKSEGIFKLSQLKLEISKPGLSLVSDFLLGLDSLGVAEDIKPNNMYEVSAYFPMESDIAEVIDSLKKYTDFLQTSMPELKVGEITAEHIDQSSWQRWKSVLKKVKVGQKIVITPPWEEHNTQGEEIVIEINPSLAFGTGHHETTRLCIEAIENLQSKKEIKKMLDVGCGSGILSIAALKLGIEEVTGFDTDPVAISESRKNAAKNDALDEINFFCGYLESAQGQYDLIVANVYIEPILSMKEGFKSRLLPNGTLIVSGIPGTRKDEAVRGLNSVGFNLHNEFVEGDWVALEFRLD